MDTSGQVTLTLPKTVTGVVTAVNLRDGESIKAGSVPIEVQGRPVIALGGEFRFYRNLRPGDTGPDVRQLEEALADLGLLGYVDDVFGSATQAAIRELYARHGYAPPLAPAKEAAASASNRGGGHPSGGGSAPSADGAGGQDATRQQSEPDPEPVVIARASELWALSELPQTVDDVTISVGSELPKADFGTYSGAVLLRGNIPRELADQAKPGADVVVSDGTTEWSGQVVADSTGAAAEGEQQKAARPSGRGVPVVVKLDDSATDLSAGRSYRITITGRSTDGPVLAVPLGAISQRADGATVVGVLAPSEAPEDGSSPVRRVTVKIGIRADGWVQILSSENDVLSEGTRVVIGHGAAADRGGGRG